MNQQISNFAGEVKYSWNGFDINSVLNAIEKFPALFLGNQSNIDSLWIYLHGYLSALRITEKQEFSFPNHYHFTDWVCGKFNHKFRSQLGWYHHIAEKCKGDKEKALERFFKYYNEFRKSIPVCYRINITEKYRKFAKNEGVIKRFKSTQDYEQKKTIVVPKTVLIFQLPPSKTHWFVYINSDGFNDYENVEMNFEKVKERINKEFQTSAKDWKKLSNEESMDLYNKVYISKEIPTETRFMTVTTEKF